MSVTKDSLYVSWPFNLTKQVLEQIYSQMNCGQEFLFIKSFTLLPILKVMTQLSGRYRQNTQMKSGGNWISIYV